MPSNDNYVRMREAVTLFNYTDVEGKQTWGEVQGKTTPEALAKSGFTNPTDVRQGQMTYIVSKDRFKIIASRTFNERTN